MNSSSTAEPRPPGRPLTPHDPEWWDETVDLDGRRNPSLIDAGDRLNPYAPPAAGSISQSSSTSPLARLIPSLVNTCLVAAFACLGRCFVWFMDFRAPEREWFGLVWMVAGIGFLTMAVTMICGSVAADSGRGRQVEESQP